MGVLTVIYQSDLVYVLCLRGSGSEQSLMLAKMLLVYLYKHNTNRFKPVFNPVSNICYQPFLLWTSACTVLVCHNLYLYLTFNVRKIRPVFLATSNNVLNDYIYIHIIYVVYLISGRYWIITTCQVVIPQCSV